MDEFRHEFLQELDGRRPLDDDSVSDANTIFNDPQSAEQYRRRREFDIAVAATFAEVPLPLGMAARLATAIEAEAVAESAQPLMPTSSPLVAAPLESVAAQSRRSWLATAGSALAATAAGGAFFVWWQNRHRADLTAEQVLEASLVFHQRAAAKRGEAKPISVSPPPAEFPISRFVTPRAEPRARLLDEPLLGRTGAVYELSPADQPRAALYVLSERPGLTAPAVTMLANAPMVHPFKTGGCAMSAWREEHRIVLLVVDGDERRYRDYLAAPQEFA